jgi:hypothetical protein
MLPGMGPRVREIQPNRSFVAGDQASGIWCLALYPAEGVAAGWSAAGG